MVWVGSWNHRFITEFIIGTELVRESCILVLEAKVVEDFVKKKKMDF